MDSPLPDLGEAISIAAQALNALAARENQVLSPSRMELCQLLFAYLNLSLRCPSSLTACPLLAKLAQKVRPYSPESLVETAASTLAPLLEIGHLPDKQLKGDELARKVVELTERGGY